MQLWETLGDAGHTGPANRNVSDTGPANRNAGHTGSANQEISTRRRMSMGRGNGRHAFRSIGIGGSPCTLTPKSSHLDILFVAAFGGSPCTLVPKSSCRRT